ncbi:MAG: hypothetical protein ACXABY_00010 [Candidatus Thorarchaeota archaeon]|jgi:ribonucleotide monophosphatase NagD (HAD superfamily)
MSEETRKYCSPDEERTIAVDFDGVIHDDDKGFHDGTVYGNPIKGAKEALKALSSKFKVIVLSAKARSDRPLINDKTGKELIQEWLDKHDMSEYVTDVTAEKPAALLYIDDKALRFMSWGTTMAQVRTYLRE